MSSVCEESADISLEQTSCDMTSAVESANHVNPDMTKEHLVHVPVDVNVQIINNGMTCDENDFSSSEDIPSVVATQSNDPSFMESNVIVESSLPIRRELWVLRENDEAEVSGDKLKVYIDQCNNIESSAVKQNGGTECEIKTQDNDSNCDNDVCVKMSDKFKLPDDLLFETDFSKGITSLNKDMYNISGCSLEFDDPPVTPNTPDYDLEAEITETSSIPSSIPEVNSDLFCDSAENLDDKLNENCSSVNLFEPEKRDTFKSKLENKRPSRHIVHPYHWKQLDSSSKSSIFDSSIDISFSQDPEHEDIINQLHVPSSPGNIDKQWFKVKRSDSSISLDPPEYFDGFGPRSWGCQCTCHSCVSGVKHSDRGNEASSSSYGLLQSQLEKSEKDARRIQEELRTEIKELKKDNERQQKLIGQNLSLGPEAKIEATMQHEITRLTSENLDLREMIDDQTQQIRKLKKLLKVYSKKLRAGEAAEIQAELDQAEIKESNGSLATVKHRERTFMGMLELKKEDENLLIKNLILDLKPKVSAGLIPGLPAYILFMIVRQTDFTNDDEKVRGLLTNTINGIKKVVKRHNDDLDRITLWLANTCRLLHTLKQYSGEKAFQTENSPKQNEQCLRNFDLSEYRQVFSDLAVWIYQGLLKRMEELIQPSIVPAILEHEAISGLNASKPSGLRGRSTSSARELDSNDYSLDSLMRSLNNYMRIVAQHAVDPELGKQIFRQVFYYICAGSLNNLLLRKDMCNWSKGMQIRYNLSHLEQWLRDNKLNESGATTALDPIIQASQLLQARKTDSDVDSISDMCSKLTNAQIVKILNLYTPVDEFEERVPISFIRKIQEKLKSRDDTNNTLLMDTKYSYPVTFPFNPSNIQLETIEVPDILHLGMVKKV